MFYSSLTKFIFLPSNIKRNSLNVWFTQYFKRIALTRGMTQAAEHLPTKHETLNSSPSTTKRKKKK
jgi:hypothetical protein